MAAYYAAALHSFSRPFKVAYPARCETRLTACVAYVQAHWQKIAIAAAIGMFAGFIAGVVGSRAGLVLTQSVYAASRAPAPSVAALKPAPPIAANQVAQDELTRLRAQNEQLETMLAELKKASPPAQTRRAKARRRRHTRVHG